MKQNDVLKAGVEVFIWGLVASAQFHSVATVSRTKFGEAGLLSLPLFTLVGLTVLFQTFFWKTIHGRWQVVMLPNRKSQVKALL